MTLLAAIFLLVIIMDPIGNVPVFLSVLKNVPIERRRKIIIRELLIALFILLFFLFIGRYILQSLQIAESSLGDCWRNYAVFDCNQNDISWG